MKGLFGELNRRNVFRVAVTYLVAAWVIAQVSGLAADAFEAPAWVMQMIIAGLVIGFLPAVILAWLFELSPEGLRRERDLVDKQAVNGYTARKLDIAVIVLLVAAIGLLMSNRLLVSGPAQPGTTVAEAPQNDYWQLDSIAVLPFADFSPTRDQAWLGEGIAETLLHALAQIEGLRVSARTSSFAYRDRVADVGIIGQELNVATVLEGSVLRVGDRLRVVAQLVRTDTHDHIFSETFDRDVDDIFAIQDEIAAAVAEALMGKAAPRQSEMARTDTGVYDLYMEGRQLWQARDRQSIDRAVELLEQAVALDPDYAPARSELATALLFQVFYGEATIEDNRGAIESHLQRALELDDEDPQAWAARGLLLQELELQNEALEALQVAEKLSPSDANIQVWLGNHYNDMVQLDRAISHFERALELDPLNTFVRRRFSAALGFINPDDPRIERIARDTVRLFPDEIQSWYTLLNLLANKSRMDETVIIALKGLQAHPGEVGLHVFVASAFNHFGETALSERWLELARKIEPELTLWSGFFMRTDPERYLQMTRDEHQNRGMAGASTLITALHINEEWEEAWQLSQDHLRHVLEREAIGGAGLDDYSALLYGIWLARRFGTEEDVRVRLDLAREKIEELRASGVFDDLVMPDLLFAAVAGDHDTATDLLPEVSVTNYTYLAWALEHDAIFEPMSDRPEARAIIEGAEQRRQSQFERLKREAAAAFEPEALIASLM